MKVFEVIPGHSPVVLAQPHGGVFVPEGIFSRLNARGQGLSDTDWHITRLYGGLLDGATVVRSNVHRYVVDANRDPGGMSLYPNQNTTTLCPQTDFDGLDIWLKGQAPGDDEIAARREAFHLPYHEALRAELDRVKARHGVAILYDCHSIRSTIPFLFEGVLPVFSIGTNDGLTCDQLVEETVHLECLSEIEYSTVLNGRFKGGWTTRHYGKPAEGTHAIQMELAQRAYMEEKTPWAYREDRASGLRAVLQKILKNLDRLARSGEFNT
ncbi:N-formylglutamate deformylase [uncultured Roseobacter sp.]|uniref:N-formylglutamate deformylase n=1 Tax=uncultured Roseobacter sp. TaxID=114847 RepID=UPI0026130313|nr:N-formylglutamate deformylase [uncultured Roseobacter sp.]